MHNPSADWRRFARAVLVLDVHPGTEPLQVEGMEKPSHIWTISLTRTTGTESARLTQNRSRNMPVV
jgi:hypothetical protein